MSEQGTRTVGADITFDVHTPATVALQIRPGETAGRVTDEQLRIEIDGNAGPAGRPIVGEYGGRIDVVELLPGHVHMSYEGTIEAPDAFISPIAGDRAYEQLVLQRPSRYAPSDHLLGFANAEFGAAASGREQVSAIATWIFRRIGYVPGTSGVHDSAEHTLLTGQGVCRDFAHLGIALCRALNIPARFAAVYAPGLFPMDFHAVFEAWHDGAWWAYDATRSAPRQTLVRVATGRDAADAPFATVTSGNATLLDLVVTAVSGTDLALDDHERPVALA